MDIHLTALHIFAKYIVMYFVLSYMLSFCKKVSKEVYFCKRKNLLKGYKITETQLRYLFQCGSGVYLENPNKGMFLLFSLEDDKILCMKDISSGETTKFPCRSWETAQRLLLTAVDNYKLLCYNAKALQELISRGYNLRKAN